ncbi:hypothetical protein [Halococcus sp. AFM35]|uniref:hypothetical protein n=1 Tax=Halococcus sp. AFM35 TaxID=3421653 RepID=UPI003EC13066
MVAVRNTVSRNASRTDLFSKTPWKYVPKTDVVTALRFPSVEPSPQRARVEADEMELTLLDAQND